MPAHHAINVSLTPELDALVRGLVGTGRYRSASEVVRSGLRLLEEHEGRTAGLRRLVQEGIDQAARGEAAPLDPDRLRASVLARAAELREAPRRRGA